MSRGWESIHHLGVDDLAFGLLGLGGCGFGRGLDVRLCGRSSGTGLGSLGGLRELLERVFQLCGGGFDAVQIIAGDRVFHGLDLAIEHRFEFRRSLITEFAELFLDGEHEVVGLVLRIDFFDAPAVFLGVSLGVLLGFFDLVFRKAGRTLDRDLLFLTGLFVLGEANFSDHGANRLGASALMQGLADGYFIIPYTIGDYLASNTFPKVDTTHAAFRDAERELTTMTKKLMSVNGKKPVDAIHKQLGKIMWDKCGMARNATGLKEALQEIPKLREEFWRNVLIPGSADSFNQELEKAHRVADFLELAELICVDALHREESCGGHFREEYQTEDGEAKRNDKKFSYVAAWEFKGVRNPETLHKEPLVFEYVKPTQRSYK